MTPKVYIIGILILSASIFLGLGFNGQLQRYEALHSGPVCVLDKKTGEVYGVDKQVMRLRGNRIVFMPYTQLKFD